MHLTSYNLQPIYSPSLFFFDSWIAEETSRTRTTIYSSLVEVRCLLLFNSRYTLGQVKFPKILNTPPQNLQMVDLVWASAKKFDFNPSNQPRIGLQHFMWLNLQYKTKKLTRPNFKIPFDYNLLFLVVVHENIVCPTTFIAKTWKFMGTSVY